MGDEFFVMISHPTLRVIPLEDIYGDVRIFSKTDDAIEAVKENKTANVYGYEIFSRAHGVARVVAQ